jgi:hypothetical protein
MNLFSYFIFSMSKRAFILKFAFSIELPIFAHLSFEFYLILSYKIFSFNFWSKILLRFLNCCYFKVFIRIGNFCWTSGFRVICSRWIDIIIFNLCWGIWIIIYWLFTIFFVFIRIWNLKEFSTLLWFWLSILLSNVSDIFSKENLLSILILFVLGTLIYLIFLKALLFIWT